MRLRDAMMRMPTWTLLALLTCSVPPAQAVCFHPGSTQSGYRIPLEQEVSATPWIVVGRVLSRVDRPDPRGEDRPGVSAYEIEVERTIKGGPPLRLHLELPNDSGAYRAMAGETHLLFVHPGAKPRVDACGNSAMLPTPVLQATLDAVRRWR